MCLNIMAIISSTELGFVMTDFQLLEVDCGACDGADLTGDEKVDMDDLTKFAENWLGGST